MMTELDALMAKLSPEEQQLLLSMGTLDERGMALQEQMAQAQALRRPSQQRHITPLGGALGGFSNAVNNVHGAYRLAELQKQQEALFDRKDTGRGTYADVMRRNQQPTGYDVVPATPFAL